MGKALRAANRRAIIAQQKKKVRYFMSEEEGRAKLTEILGNDLNFHWEINAPLWLNRDLWSLHKNYGWGKKRLNKYVENKIKEFKRFHSGIVSDEEIEQKLKDIGVVVEFEKRVD